MRKHLLIASAFSLLLIYLFILRNGQLPSSEVLHIFTIYSIPFIVIAGIIMGMSYALQKGRSHRISFIKSFRNLQVLLNVIYLLAVLYNWNFFTPTKNDSVESCEKENIHILAGDINPVSDSEKARNLRAYGILKTRLRELGTVDDTALCLTAFFAKPIDTVLEANEMKWKITMDFTLFTRGGHYFSCDYYCNDSVGFITSSHHALQAQITDSIYKHLTQP